MSEGAFCMTWASIISSMSCISAAMLPSVDASVGTSSLLDQTLFTRAEFIQSNKINVAASISKPSNRSFVHRSGGSRGHARCSIHHASSNRFRFEVLTLLINGNLLLHGQCPENGLLSLPFYGNLRGILEFSGVSICEISGIRERSSSWGCRQQ